ncbi:BatD family protein [Azoarcus sp. KH32C]|uniref:BatD family protein n=1 Tax=Azoarcus sp. KH32C TaxID=748247 RepID=UPI0002386AEB|nr:BatD family protein [Azoarcus sp. KH32C]BAL22711.1 hypothetical protein AZKH_0365 [Azoarcus sp. KH32C]
MVMRLRDAARPHWTALAMARLACAIALILAVGRAMASDGANADLWIEAQLEPDTVYVQAQAIYTLRLYQAVSTRELAFHAPRSAFAEIRASAGEKVDEVTRAGRRYRVTERRYLILPFASGPLPLTDGHVSIQANSTGKSAERRIDAPPLTLAVRAIPFDRRGEDWLPARTLTLTESWQPAGLPLKPGQALRRTIRIEARGLSAAQLPALQPDAEGFSVHPEPPRLEEREDEGGIIGTREQTWLMVPRQSGDLTIPALRLAWWDTLNNAARHADLPARTIMAMTSPATAASPAIDVSAQAISSAPPVSPPLAPSAAPVNAPASGPALITTFAGLALLAMAAALIWLRRNTPYFHFRRACRNNDPLAARAALLQWRGKGLPPAPASLLAIAQHLGGQATRTELGALDRQLYGPACTPWNGQRLLAALHAEHPGLRRTLSRMSHSSRRTPRLATENPTRMA